MLCGVPQGSVLGPTIWNLFYDGVLRLRMPPVATLVAFADDLAVVVVAHTTELLEDLINPILDRVDHWMTDNGLSPALEKAVCALLTNKRSLRDPLVRFSGTVLPVKRVVHYLGVHLDTRLSFVQHARIVSAGAKKAAVALGKLMPNVGGPSQSRRLLLMSV